MTTENFYFCSIQHTDSGVAGANKALQPTQKMCSWERLGDQIMVDQSGAILLFLLGVIPLMFVVVGVLGSLEKPAYRRHASVVVIGSGTCALRNRVCAFQTASKR
jgi:hypothetical protein